MSDSFLERRITERASAADSALEESAPGDSFLARRIAERRPEEDPGLVERAGDLASYTAGGVGRAIARGTRGVGRMPDAILSDAVGYSDEELSELRESGIEPRNLEFKQSVRDRLGEALPEENTLTRAGDRLESATNEALGQPGPDDTTGQIFDAVGQVGAFLMPGPLRMLGSGGRAASVAGSGGLAAGSGADEAAQRVEDARRRGVEVSESDEDSAISGGSVIGISELAPVERILRFIPKRLSGEAGRTVADALKRVAAQGTAEGAQEALAGVAQDLQQKGIYDPDLEVGESILQEFKVGAGAGAIVQAMVEAAVRRGNVSRTAGRAMIEELEAGGDPQAVADAFRAERVSEGERDNAERQDAETRRQLLMEEVRGRADRQPRALPNPNRAEADYIVGDDGTILAAGGAGRQESIDAATSRVVDENRRRTGAEEVLRRTRDAADSQPRELRGPNDFETDVEGRTARRGDENALPDPNQSRSDYLVGEDGRTVTESDLDRLRGAGEETRPGDEPPARVARRAEDDAPGPRALPNPNRARADLLVDRGGRAATESDLNRLRETDAPVQGVQDEGPARVTGRADVDLPGREPTRALPNPNRANADYLINPEGDVIRPSESNILLEKRRQETLRRAGDTRIRESVRPRQERQDPAPAAPEQTPTAPKPKILRAQTAEELYGVQKGGTEIELEDGRVFLWKDDGTGMWNLSLPSELGADDVNAFGTSTRKEALSDLEGRTVQELWGGARSPSGQPISTGRALEEEASEPTFEQGLEETIPDLAEEMPDVSFPVSAEKLDEISDLSQTVRNRGTVIERGRSQRLEMTMEDAEAAVGELEGSDSRTARQAVKSIRRAMNRMSLREPSIGTAPVEIVPSAVATPETRSLVDRKLVRTLSPGDARAMSQIEASAVPPTDGQITELADALQDLVDAGMPESIVNSTVGGFFVFDDPNGMSYGAFLFDSGLVGVNGALLEMSPRMEVAATELRASLAHEIGHAIDADPDMGGWESKKRREMYATVSPHTGEVVPGPSATVIREAMDAHEAGTSVGSYFAYPLSFAGEMVESGDRLENINAWVTSEVFAQAFALYYTAPQALQAEVPSAVAVIEELINEKSDLAAQSSGSEVRGGAVSGAVREARTDATDEARVQAPLRGTRQDPGVARDRGADPGRDGRADGRERVTDDRQTQNEDARARKDRLRREALDQLRRPDAVRAGGVRPASAPAPELFGGGADRARPFRVLNQVVMAKERTPDSRASSAFDQAGFYTGSFLEMNQGAASADAFFRAVTASKSENPYGAAVYVYPQPEYRDMRLFITEDGTSGFALKGDDIVSVFSGGGGKAVPAMMLATQEGGRRLDAFETVLPELYSMAGFRAVSRQPWNDEFAPDDWNKDTFQAFNGGEPDVVFMAFDPGNSSFYTPGEGVTTDTYDEAVDLQREAVAQAQERIDEGPQEQVSGSEESPQERRPRSDGDAARDDAGGRGVPVYGEAREGAVRVRARHYSQERRDRLSGSQYGQGARGDERARVMGAPEELQNRIYFYVDDGNGITPEGGVGSVAHEVDLANIYDPRTGLLDNSLARRDANAFEMQVIDAGFDGYMAKFGPQRAVVLLGAKHQDVPVAPVGADRPDVSRSAASTQTYAEALRDGGLMRNPGQPSTNRYNLDDETRVQRFLRIWQDKMVRLKVAQRSITESAGIADLPDEINAYRKEELFHGKVADDLEVLEEKFIDRIAKVLQNEKLSQAELDVYLYAQHAQERNDYIASIRDDMPDGGSGMTNAEARAILQKARDEGKTRGLQRASKVVMEMLEENRQRLRDAGLLDEDTVGAWRSQYDNYVPLKGFAEVEGEPIQRTGRGFSLAGNESLAALGRRTLAASPLANSVQDVTEKIIRSRKNEIAKSFLGMVEAHADPSLWVVHRDSSSAPTESVKIGDRVVERPVDMRSAKRIDNGDPRFFAVKQDGQTVYIEIKDALLNRAMHNAGVEKINGATEFLVKTSGVATRTLSMLNTTLNPEFFVVNAARDLQAALFNVTREQELEDGRAFQKKLTKDMLRDYFPSMRAFWRGTRGVDGATAEQQELDRFYREFREDGAMTGWAMSLSLQEQQNRINRLARLADSGALARSEKGARDVINFIEDANLAVENAVRLSAYMNGRRQGLSRDQAASLAKNLTVNFNRRGEITTLVNSLYMFFNAAVQGNAQLLRSLGTDPRKVGGMTMAQKAAASMVVGGVMVTLFNAAASAIDDDEESFYAKIPEYEKERNIIFMNPANGEDYVKIPLPYGYNIFHVTGSAITEAFLGETSSAQAGLRMLHSFFDGFSPIGLPSSDDAMASMRGAAPTVTQPILDLMVNENHFGSPIYRENFPTGTQLPDSSLSTRNASELAKGLATFLNDISGGEEYVTGAVDISPDSIEHLVGFATGGLGRFTLRSYAMGEKLVEGQELEVRQIPFLRQVAGEPSKWENMGRYYDRRYDVEQVINEAEGRRGKEKFEWIREHKDMIRLRPVIESTESKLREIRATRRKVENLPQSDRTRAAVEKLVEREFEQYDRFNRAYNRLVE